MSSWMRDEGIKRSYRIEDGTMWLVVNDFQVVVCPHCQEYQYGRLTQLWHFDPARSCLINFEAHNNYGTDLEQLKSLLISYLTVNGVKEGVTEEQREGKWVLVCDNQIIGEEVMESQEMEQ